mmetsp:Transcript_105593/g.305513  ORF Transcript_105593/g.305513 Transcript_105593/m.305513 type:complete len:209 (+) Transcript_105593:960-1586(+)
MVEGPAPMSPRAGKFRQRSHTRGAPPLRWPTASCTANLYGLGWKGPSTAARCATPLPAPRGLALEAGMWIRRWTLRRRRHRPNAESSPVEVDMALSEGRAMTSLHAPWLLPPADRRRRRERHPWAPHGLPPVRPPSSRGRPDLATEACRREDRRWRGAAHSRQRLLIQLLNDQAAPLMPAPAQLQRPPVVAGWLPPSPSAFGAMARFR